jgi:hypothetical protein
MGEKYDQSRVVEIINHGTAHLVELEPNLAVMEAAKEVDLFGWADGRKERVRYLVMRGRILEGKQRILRGAKL